MQRLSIKAGSLSLDVVPGVGGSVGRFRLGDVDLMRPLPGDKAHALHSGMFPMAPFANCIRDNSFVFSGRRYEISPNIEGAVLNFHGSAWLSEWQVRTHEGTTLELCLDDGRMNEVYRYAARQRFALDEKGLTVALEVANRGPAPMPFGFGLHPWFPRHGRALVRFRSAGRWCGDADGRAIAFEPAAGKGEYSEWSEPPTSYQNFCHTEWDGEASILWPRLGLGMAITADRVFTQLMFHVPASGEGVFCLEPQSNAPCGFDDLANGAVPGGVFVLATGKSIAGSVRFAPYASADDT